MTRLEELFNTLVKAASKPSVVRSADAYMEYLVCVTAVLQRPRQPDSPVAGGFAAYGEYAAARLADVHSLAPEVALAPGAVRLDGDARTQVLDADALIVAPVSPDGERLGILPATCRENGVYEAAAVIPASPTCDLGDSVAYVTFNESLTETCRAHPDLRLSITRLRGTAAVMAAILEDGDELMYVLSASANAPLVKEIIMPDGRRLRPDGWNDKDRCYRRLKRGDRKMKGLGNPVTGRKEAAAAEAPQEGSKREVATEAAVEAALTAEVSAKVAEPPRATPQAAPEAELQEQEAAATEVAAADVQEDAAKEEPRQQPAQRTRRAQQASGKYGIAALQQMATDIAAQQDPADVDQIDGSIEELRALRDLQVSASRRMANLGVWIAKVTRGAVEKYSAIKSLLR